MSQLPAEARQTPTSVVQALYEAIDERDIRQRARGTLSGVEVEIRIGHLWTVTAGSIIKLEVFPAAGDARQAAADRSSHASP